MATIPEIVAGMKKEMENMAERIEKLETLNDALTEIKMTQVEISTRLGMQEKTMQNVEKKVNELAEEPAKKWKSFIKAVGAALVTALVTYLFTKVYYTQP